MSKRTPKIIPGDWNSVAHAIAKLDAKLNSGAAPTFSGLTLSGLTASRLAATDASEVLVSVADLTSWITGTANQILITDNGDGTITLSLPQNIHTAADVQFGSADITNTATVGRLLAGGVTE